MNTQSFLFYHTYFICLQLADGSFVIGSSSTVERLVLGNVIFSGKNSDYKHVSEPDSDTVCEVAIVDTRTDDETSNIEKKEAESIEKQEYGDSMVYALDDRYYDETSSRDSSHGHSGASELVF